MNNYTPTPDFYKDYIAHFGILGQKWGKKNGPPYPLGAGDHSAAEKKAGYTKSKEGKRNTKLYSDGGSGSSSQRKKEYDGLKKKPVNEMTDQEFNKFLKGIDDKEVRELARNERNKNKQNTRTQEIDNFKKDKNVSFSDMSYNQQASEKITKNDISTLYNLKNQTKEIAKIIKSNSDLNNKHSKLENLSKKIKKPKDLSFYYSGYGSNGAQFDGYNESTDVGFTVFVNKDGKMIIELDYWG